MVESSDADAMYFPSGEKDRPKIVARCPPMHNRSFLGVSLVRFVGLALIVVVSLEEDGSGWPKKAECRRLASRIARGRIRGGMFILLLLSSLSFACDMVAMALTGVVRSGWVRDESFSCWLFVVRRAPRHSGRTLMAG